MRVSINFNFWALLFGPFYFAAVGVWRRGLAIFGILVELDLILERVFGSGVSSGVGGLAAVIFASTVNYYRFIKITQGRDEWSPMTDLYLPRAGATARAE